MKLFYHTSKLRGLVANNVFLYKIWFYTVRKFRGDYVRLPSRNDHFYFDGYPRSGNTFFKNFIKKIYPQKEFANHLHSISGIKIALKLELPIFIMIRKPEDAIASNLYRKVNLINHDSHELLIERLLTSYFNYYNFVKENIHYVNILQFELAVDNEILVPKIIADILEFDNKSNAFIEEKLHKYKLLMKSKEAKKNSRISSLPHDNRKIFKSKNISKILNSPSYKMVENIYNELIEYDLLSGELEARSSF